MLRRFRWVVVLLVMVSSAASAQAASAFVSPFPTNDYFVGRTDMGVDVCLSPGDQVVAVGQGVIVGIQHNWYKNEPYIWYRLTAGPDAGRYVYVAEQIRHLAHVGETVTAGQRVATYAGMGTCIETGWAAANGETLAQATTGYQEGEVTRAGVSFAHFLIAQGVQGNFELTAPKPQIARHRHRRH